MSRRSPAVRRDAALTPLPLPIVFIGPSLPLEEAEGLLVAEFRAPLRAGDLDQVPDRALVGIVDGVLEPSCRLCASEVKRAAERGVQLYGAASTGALLAVTTPHVEGLGRIAGLLRRYQLQSAQDLISVLYSEHDNERLTEPLVHAVLWAEDRGYPTEEFLTRLRKIPLPQRSPENLVRCAAEVFGEAHPQLRFPDIKRSDARVLLHTFLGIPCR